MEIRSLLMKDGAELAYRFFPTEKEEVVLQIVHGALEYSGRYQVFAEWLAERGVSVYAMDNRGHGLNQEPDAQGVVMPEGASQLIPEDVITLGRKIRAEHQSPVVLLGHSMGSFIARVVLTLDHPYSAFLFSGSGLQKESDLRFALPLVRLLQRVKGSEAMSKKLDDLSFRSLKKSMKRKGLIREEIEWLSSDPVRIEENRRDRLLNQRFTISAYRAMFELIAQAQNPLKMAAVEKKMPLLFLSGGQDPVGHYGEDLAKLATLYRTVSGAHVTTLLYPSMRHEILNEEGREEVFQDILHYLKRIHA